MSVVLMGSEREQEYECEIERERERECERERDMATLGFRIKIPHYTVHSNSAITYETILL